MSSKPTVIYTAANLPQAHLLRNMLEDLGIPATVTNDAVQQAIGDIPAGWSTAPRVVVAEEHAELARRVAMEFDSPDRDRLPDDESAEHAVDTAELVAGPHQPLLLACPSCGSRRQAVCAYCGTSGDDFVPADSSDSRSAGARRPWLICATCQEPFAAQYERVCERCGHDYREGAERPMKAPALLFSRFGLALMVIGLAATVLLVLWQPTMACLLLLVIGLATMARWSLGGPTP